MNLKPTLVRDTAASSASPANPSSVSASGQPDFDYTIVHHDRSVPANREAKLVPVSAVAPMARTVRTAVKLATLEIALHHHLKPAEITVWVDEKLAYSGAVYGETKKHLLVLHEVNGAESHEIRVAEGQHDLKVRVASPSAHYDHS